MLDVMDEESSYISTELLKLEKYVRTLETMRNATTLSRVERDHMFDLRDTLADARKLANDAATSEITDIKLSSFSRCQEQLEAFREALLAASQYNLVDTVDVAHLSAMADKAYDLIRHRMQTVA